MRMLDNVIDINYYPVPPPRTRTSGTAPSASASWGCRTRSTSERMPFDSPEAVDFNDEIMEAIAFYAYRGQQRPRRRARGLSARSRARSGIAACCRSTRSTCSKRSAALPILVDRKSRMQWEGLREKIRRQGMRNSNCLAIAPTATISNIMGCTPVHRAELQAHPHEVEPQRRVRPHERLPHQGAA